ncbi:MAG UNVERIFIED_CONTAM: hypothetical protein LVQ98_07695 [Rickettsiaceae bacterium]
MSHRIDIVQKFTLKNLAKLTYDQIFQLNHSDGDNYNSFEELIQAHNFVLEDPANVGLLGGDSAIE